MLMLFFFLKVSSLLVQILESTNTTGTLGVQTWEEGPHWILVTFPKHTVPFLIDTGACKISREDEKTSALFYSKSPATLKIKYEKELQKIMNLDYKIERGFKFDSIILVKKEDGVIMSNIVTDIFPIPDFSAPFISFSTWGAIFGMIFNLFINQS